MIFGSVCSGIEAASVAWEPLGWSAAFLSEIAPFPRAVLAHRFPRAPLRGDFTEIKAGDHAAIDVLVGGTPCQSFSIAGLRGGMDDARGNLALEYLRLADRLRPRWLVWENVPGVLSSNGGRDFGAFLGGLVELGYGFGYRVLDAQYFGLAQRRARVFVVGYLGDWRRAAAVLFEPASLRGDPAPSRKAGSSAAGTLGSNSPGGGRRFGADEAGAGHLIAGTMTKSSNRSGDFDGASRGLIAFGGNNTSGPIEVATALNACKTASGRQDFETETFIAVPPIAFDPTQITSRQNRSNPKPGDPCHTLAKGQRAPSVAFDTLGTDVCVHGDRSGTLDTAGRAGIATPFGVRRLTPRECERLQGFPDDWTRIPQRKGWAADGPRYAAIGNSMAVPVMRWIGERIAAEDAR